MEITTCSSTNNFGMCDGAKLYGQVTYKAYDKDGNLVDTRTTHNNIVLGIRLPIIKLLSGYQSLSSQTLLQKLPFVRKIRLGSDYTAPSATDVRLHAEIEGSANLTVSEPQVDESGPSVTFAFMYSPTSSIDDKTINEMGLYACNEDGTSETMIARTVVGGPSGGWKKLNGLYFEIYWTIGYQSTPATE